MLIKLVAQLSVLENYSIKSYIAALSVARCCNFDTLNSCIGIYLENIDLFEDVLSLVSGYISLLGVFLGNIDNLKLKFARLWENIGWPFDSFLVPTDETRSSTRLDSIERSMRGGYKRWPSAGRIRCFSLNFRAKAQRRYDG